MIEWIIIGVLAFWVLILMFMHSIEVSEDFDPEYEAYFVMDQLFPDPDDRTKDRRDALGQALLSAYRKGRIDEKKDAYIKRT